MFSNKTAVVTGASSGIGYETARLLAKKQARVFAVARRQDRLQSLAAEFSNIVPVPLDVCGDLSILLEALNGDAVDILVNNAGLAWGKEPVQEAPREKWETMIDTNVKALISVTQALLPQLQKAPQGNIVNMGSIASFEFYGGGAAYCASKAAVRALTKAWRSDLLEKGIRVIGIHPGMVETEFSVVRFDGDQKAAHDVYQGMKPLTGLDVAESVVWALSCPEHVNVESLVLMPTDQASCFKTHRG